MLSSLCLQTLIAWPSGICCSRQAAWLVSVLFPIYSTWQIAKCTTGLGQFRQHWAVLHLSAGQKLGNTQESLWSHSCGTCWPVFRKLCLHKCHSVYDCHGGVVLLPHHTPSGACLNAAHWGSSYATVNFATGHFTCATVMMHFSTSFRVMHSLVYHCYQQFVKTCGQMLPIAHENWLLNTTHERMVKNFSNAFVPATPKMVY